MYTILNNIMLKLLWIFFQFFYKQIDYINFIILDEKFFIVLDEKNFLFKKRNFFVFFFVYWSICLFLFVFLLVSVCLMFVSIYLFLSVCLSFSVWLSVSLSLSLSLSLSFLFLKIVTWLFWPRCISQSISCKIDLLQSPIFTDLGLPLRWQKTKKLISFNHLYIHLCIHWLRINFWRTKDQKIDFLLTLSYSISVSWLLFFILSFCSSL